MGRSRSVGERVRRSWRRGGNGIRRWAANPQTSNRIIAKKWLGIDRHLTPVFESVVVIDNVGLTIVQSSAVVSLNGNMNGNRGSIGWAGKRRMGSPVTQFSRERIM